MTLLSLFQFPKPFWAEEDGTGGGDAATPPAAAELPVDDAAVSEDADASDQTDTDEASTDDAGDAPTDFVMEPPEGMEAFADDFKSFSSDMDKWMKENPDASVADALMAAASRQAKMVSEASALSDQQFEQNVEAWETQSRADEEIGGDNFDANVSVAMKAIETFGTDELKAVLQDTGLGSHPEIIRFAMKAGAALQDAGVVGAGEPGGASDSLKHRYNNSKG